MTKIQTTGSPRVLTVIDSPGGGHRSVGAPIRKRSIVRDGHKSSASMEDHFGMRFERLPYARTRQLQNWSQSLIVAVTERISRLRSAYSS